VLLFTYLLRLLLRLRLLPLLPGAELPLVECFDLLNDLFPFPSNLDPAYPVLELQLANVLFDVILPSVLGSFSWSFSWGFQLNIFITIFQLPIHNLLLVFLCTRFRLHPLNSLVPFLCWELLACKCFPWTGSWPFAQLAVYMYRWKSWFCYRFYLLSYHASH